MAVTEYVLKGRRSHPAEVVAKKVRMQSVVGWDLVDRRLGVPWRMGVPAGQLVIG